MFAFGHAYQGRTLQVMWYPKKGCDQIGFAFMSLSLLPQFGLWALAFFPAFWAMFASGPGKWNPFAEGQDWFPDDIGDDPFLVSCRDVVRYAWGSLLVAGLYIYLINIPIGVTVIPACGLAMGVGYLFAAQVMNGSDREGKIVSGFLTGLVLALLTLIKGL